MATIKDLAKILRHWVTGAEKAQKALTRHLDDVLIMFESDDEEDWVGFLTLVDFENRFRETYNYHTYVSGMGVVEQFLNDEQIHNDQIGHLSVVIDWMNGTKDISSVYIDNVGDISLALGGLDYINRAIEQLPLFISNTKQWLRQYEAATRLGNIMDLMDEVENGETIINVDRNRRFAMIYVDEYSLEYCLRFGTDGLGIDSNNPANQNFDSFEELLEAVAESVGVVKWEIARGDE